MDQTVHGKYSYARVAKSTMRSFLLLLLCLGLLAASGCATTKKLYSKVAPGSSGLKKRVLVLPFWDQADLGAEKLDQLTTQFLSLLNKDSSLSLRWAKGLQFLGQGEVSEYGIVTDPEQARRADQMGMNVMLTAVFSPFDTQRIKTGLWPFEKLRTRRKSPCT